MDNVLGNEESVIASLLIMFLNNFVQPRKLGIVTGADGTIRLFPGSGANPGGRFRLGELFPQPEAAGTSHAATRP